jgi:hypothetical protein
VSQELEMIEKMASVRSYTDAEIIDSILNKFLDMDYPKLIMNNNIHCYLAKDIAKGFALNNDMVSCCTIKEILTLIGYEPSAPWYKIPKEDAVVLSGTDDRSLFSAGNCFLLCRILNDSNMNNLVVKQLMHIDYGEFIKLLSGKYIINKDNASAADFRVMKKKMRLEGIRHQTIKILCDRYPVLREDRITVGDVIKGAYMMGTSSWICGTEPLLVFAERVRTGDKLMNWFFMDCIRLNMIRSDRGQFKELLNKCSPLGLYSSEKYAELNFDNCYEFNYLEGDHANE